VRLETVKRLRHDDLSSSCSGGAPFPDHANRGAPRPPGTVLEGWSFGLQPRESREFMTISHASWISLPFLLMG
jgi:hypothetical protein